MKKRKKDSEKIFRSRVTKTRVIKTTGMREKEGEYIEKPEWQWTANI